jgi:hypothetical protein
MVMMPQNSIPQGEYLQVHWNNIIANNSTCAGGFAFTWIDEWWKLGNVGVQDPGTSQNYAFPGQWDDEEAYGLFAVMPNCNDIPNYVNRTDPITPRAAYYYLGYLYGTFDEIPQQAYTPINYAQCNGDWIGQANTPDSPIYIPPEAQFLIGPVSPDPPNAPSRASPQPSSHPSVKIPTPGSVPSEAQFTSEPLSPYSNTPSQASSPPFATKPLSPSSNAPSQASSPPFSQPPSRPPFLPPLHPRVSPSNSTPISYEFSFVIYCILILLYSSLNILP